jgi:hypothetical protein
LPLILAKVLDDERFHVRNAEQALARGVDGEASKVTSNPAAVEFFGDGGGGAGSDKAVKDKGVLAG